MHKKPDALAQELGKRGGLKTLEKYGKTHFQRIRKAQKKKRNSRSNAA